MKAWAKGGLIGFVVAFIGLWAILFIIGYDAQGWKCITLTSADYCTFTNFISSFVHWGFVLFFSWVGFFAGVIDSRIIKKILRNKKNIKTMPLKITSVIMLSFIIVFSIICLLVFDDWITIIVYSIIFVLFVILISWAIGKIKYG